MIRHRRDIFNKPAQNVNQFIRCLTL